MIFQRAVLNLKMTMDLYRSAKSSEEGFFFLVLYSFYFSYVEQKWLHNWGLIQADTGKHKLPSPVLYKQLSGQGSSVFFYLYLYLENIVIQNYYCQCRCGHFIPSTSFILFFFNSLDLPSCFYQSFVFIFLVFPSFCLYSVLLVIISLLLRN